MKVSKSKQKKETKKVVLKDNEEVARKSDEAETMTESESDSSSIAKGGRLWQSGSKRPAEEIDEPGLSEEEAVPAPKMATARRGRGRPPTTGHYVGLAKAKADFMAMEREELELQAEKEVAEITAQIRANRGSSAASEDHSAPSPTRVINDSADVITLVASKSKNLKGTFQRSLKEAAAAIRQAAESLSVRTATDESRSLRAECAQLRANNTRLQAELEQLREEMAQLRAELICSQRTAHKSAPAASTAPQKGSPTLEEITGAVMRQVGVMLDARLEGVVARLPPEERVRPPLASDVRVAPTPAKSAPSGERSSSRKMSKTTAAASVSAWSQPLPSAKVTEESWVKVVNRGKKSGTNQARGRVAASGRAQTTSAPRQPKLRPPRSSAVVITLQPGAEEKGLTYAAVLTEARNSLDLPSLGIDGLRFRKAVTGARVLEIPGATSAGKADSLAAKLRESLGDENIRITRPTKCAELRVVGLDDSVTSGDVAAAVARAGDCAVDAVKAGEIRTNSSGLGTCWVRCPVTAAKKVSSEGRLLVGWVSAQIRLLPPKPMRCYRCLENGHVRVQCTAVVDRSECCYRCGEVGHKSAQCTAAPKCCLCAAAGHPADHSVGGKNCAANKKNTRKPRRAQQKADSRPAPAPSTVMDHEEESYMST